MNKWIFFILGWCVMCLGREPFKPREGSVPFVVYYLSHYRGICVGTLVSRTAVITAAVCIVDHAHNYHDTRAINVVAATSYRHPRRGIRVQVSKVLIPKLSNMTAERAFVVQQSPAIMLLARQVPDVLAEIALRPIDIDYKGEVVISLHDECLMIGWHFFYKGDSIYPTYKFLLQRNIRVQYLTVAKKTLWCNIISLKYQKVMTNLGYVGRFDRTTSICMRDPDREAQPCHGMYGAPLICHGRVVGMLMAPDAQWDNCTGFTNIVHLFTSDIISNFMSCVSRLFLPEYTMVWEKFKKSLDNDQGNQPYDYLPEMYDKVLYSSSSSEEK